MQEEAGEGGSGQHLRCDAGEPDGWGTDRDPRLRRVDSKADESEAERAESADRGDDLCACSEEGAFQAGEAAEGGVEGAGGGVSEEVSCVTRASIVLCVLFVLFVFVGAGPGQTTANADTSPELDEPVPGRPGWIRRTLWVEDAYSQSRSYKGDLGDYDGDGYLDYIVANIFGYSRVFVNDGRGLFTPTTPFPEGSARVMTFADLDGDGDLDVAEGSSDRRRSHIYVHSDDGTFTRIVELKGGDVRDFEWADYNGDGYLDVAVAYEQDQGYEDGQHNLLCIGNGDWGFEQQYAFGSRLTMALCSGDFDSDGDLDVALGNGSFDGETVVHNELYLNDGKGRFVGMDALGWGATWDIECGDLDGDGVLDVVVANQREPLSVYFNRGDLKFERRYLSDAAGGGDLAIDLADLDEDGDLDMTVAMRSPASGVTLFVNRGNGTFDEIPNFPEREGPHDVLWGDADGDGDQDLFMARYRANNLVYLNPGDGMGPVTSVPEVDVAFRPSGYRLSQNHPNPFNPETTISYDVAKTGTVRLSVYALTGQLVRILVDGERLAGSYSVTWDGTDGAGRDVASGVYLCRMVAGSYSAVGKLVLMK